MRVAMWPTYRLVWLLVWMIVLLFVGTLPARAQNADEDVRQQLQELKKQYEQTTLEFQKRIADLEEKIDKQNQAMQKNAGNSQGATTAVTSSPSAPSAPTMSGAAAAPAATSTPPPVTTSQSAPATSTTVSTGALAAQVAKQVFLGQSEQVGQHYQGDLASEPTYDLINEAEVKIAKLTQQVDSFEFHGYFRSGAGTNSIGGQMVAFQAPGAGAKYRLGNEAETYGEFIFVNNWLNPGKDPGKAWFKTEVMIEANTTNSDTYANFPNGIGNDQFRLREAFVRAGDLFAIQPTAKFWAGERYYRRQHIEIDDFYPLDTSGYGAGIEDLNVHFGKMAVAYLSGARPDFVTQNGNFAKNNLDVRLYDMKAHVGWLGAWFDYATEKGGTTTAGQVIPTTSGYAGGVRYQNLEWHGGYNAIVVQYGTGAASNFSTSVDIPTTYQKSSERLQVTNHLLVQPNDRFAIMPIFIYQRTRDGDGLHGHNDWVSFGARPEIFFTRYISLAFEGGVDYTDGFNTTVDGRVDGWLRKFTIAPQIGAGRKFFSRPVLRTFFTYANWTNGFRGLVGGVPYQNRTDGISFGVQAETWW
ncbi:maltoporin [Granulicella sp. L60]|jgi:maltoporin|uniref:maltoporin n=1 Tax=Granulicella sp. L60 TaxID=1641866 RepID=UPI00131B1C9D|nr:carbohydrate porin [Granulicella sp. L60]